MSNALPVVRGNNALQGGLWMVACAIFYTVESSIIRVLGPGWPSPVTLFWREVATCSMLLPVVFYMRGTPLRTRQPKMLLFRSVTGTIGLLLSIYAIARLPLAAATTLSFTRPMWIALLAALFLGERLNRWKAISLIIGFSGVLWMVRPGADIADHAAAMADIAAALVFAASLVSIRYMTAADSPMTILVYGQFLGLIFTTPLAIYYWRTPEWHELAILLSVGLVSLGTTISYIKALDCAQASVVGPMEYLRLPIAMVAGLLLLGEVPQSATLVGALLILTGAAISAYGGLRGRPVISGEVTEQVPSPRFYDALTIDDFRARFDESIQAQLSEASAHLRNSYWTDSRTGRNVGTDELAAIGAMEAVRASLSDDDETDPHAFADRLLAELDQAAHKYREAAPDPDGYGIATIGTVIRELRRYCYDEGAR